MRGVARVGRRRLVIRLVVVAGIVGILNGVLPVAPAAAATDKLPDLKIGRVTDFSIQRTASGRRLLRFSGMMMNVGRGPLEIRGRRASTKKPWIVEQVIYRTNGTKRRVRTTATMRYAGDGHNHWHVRQMMSYHLWSTHGTSRDAKIGFCFFDTNRRTISLPGAPRARKYGKNGCGTRGSLHTSNGISVGWADLYPAKFAFQWIDITGLPAGTYMVRGAVDLYDKFQESSETNNCTWSRISFKATGSKVKVLASGSKCLNDHDATPYAADIDWAVAKHISADCDADMFCTYDPVSRGELATFIARAMKLPASDKDFFTDDKGSVHEADINKVAAAGILGPCATNKFCPDRLVTRGAMAAALAHALALPPTEKDYFTDDETTSYEPSINEVAEAGLMTGCTPTTFCPTVKITRGETMRSLHKAFGAEPPPPPPPAATGANATRADSVLLGGLKLVGLNGSPISFVASSTSLTLADEDPSSWAAIPDDPATGIATASAQTSGPILTCVIRTASIALP